MVAIIKIPNYDTLEYFEGIIMAKAFIKKIDSIKGFGSFVDFKWAKDLKEFKKYNLIFGWNGSGKTTLSKVFGCYEAEELPTGKEDANISITNEKGSTAKDDYSVLSKKIKVFNRDYVSNNISWDEGSTNALVYVGKDVIEDVEKLKTAQRNLEEAEGEKDKASQKITTALSDLDSYTQGKAREIREILGWDSTRYKKNSLENDLKDMVEGNLSALVLTDDEVREIRNVIGEPNTKESIENIDGVEINVQEIVGKVKELLETNIESDSKIKALEADNALDNWARTGHPLHKERDECGYCGNDISDERKK